MTDDRARLEEKMSREDLDAIAAFYRADADLIDSLPDGITRGQLGNAIESRRDVWRIVNTRE